VAFQRDARHRPAGKAARGITIHRPKHLIGRDFRRQQNIRVTSPARTLLDCAPALTDKALKRAFNDGRRSKHARVRPHQIQDVVDRFPYHPGARRLKALLRIQGGPTRSEWEDEFPAFCKRFGLPEPTLSTYVAGYEADAFFEEEKIVIELDSWTFHNDKDAFESDRDTDVDRLLAGCITVRITWERIKFRSAREAARLRELAARRRRELAA
jgi:hypothetical protein